MDEAKVPRFLEALEPSGLLYRTRRAAEGALRRTSSTPASRRCSTSWLSEAFAHPFWERMMSGKGSARLFTGWLDRALPLHEERQPPHAALLRARAREGHQAAARQALRRGVEPLPLLHQVAARRSASPSEIAELGAAPHDAGALELHAAGRARGHPRLLDLLGRARGDDRQPQDLQPLSREGRPSSTASPRRPLRPSTRTSISTSSTSTRISSSTSSAPCRRCRPRARGAGARVRPPARRAHLDVDRQHREVLRQSSRTRCRAGRSTSFLD